MIEFDKYDLESVFLIDEPHLDDTSSLNIQKSGDQNNTIAGK